MPRTQSGDEGNSKSLERATSRGYLLGLTLALTSPWNIGFWFAVIGGQQSGPGPGTFANSVAVGHCGRLGRGRLDARSLHCRQARRAHFRTTGLAGRDSGTHFGPDAFLCGETAVCNCGERIIMATRETTLTINEIYHSIQGESTWAGLPCVFVRLTFCDLRCTYCDTEYAFYEGKKQTLPEIVEAVAAFQLSAGGDHRRRTALAEERAAVDGDAGGCRSHRAAGNQRRA